MTVAESLDRLQTKWNSNAWDADTNPFGMADGGHAQKSTIDTTKTNWDQHIADIALVASAVQGVNATSGTALTIGTGSKTFTLDVAGVGFLVDRVVRAESAADNTKFMQGEVTTAPGAGSTLIVNVRQTGGTGSVSDWVINLAGTGGTIDIGKHTLWIPANAMSARSTNGATLVLGELPTNDVMVNSFDYDPAVAKAAQWTIHMPKSWDEGPVSGILVWTAASGSGAVVWQLRARAYGDNDALDAAFGTAQSVTDTLLLANDEHHSPETAAITIGGAPAENDRVNFEVLRDAPNAADTLAVDAKLIGVKLFITLAAGDDF